MTWKACFVTAASRVSAGAGVAFCLEELKYDVSRARKLIPIREEDWCFQAFSLEDPDVIYMRTVGAFGFASAAFHWQLIAAALV